MLRLTMALWWSLALVWLIAGPLDADAPNGAPLLRREVKGYGQTVDAAKKNALREAVSELGQYLRTRRPPLVHWQPTEPFVEQHLLDGPGHADADVQLDDLGPAKSWVVQLKMPGDTTLVHWDRQAERQERAEQRLGQTLSAVVTLCLMLTLVVGYIRLDEWTRSRYTAWLRLAGVSLVALGAAGWWWKH
jgi:hypothetical protein